MLIPESWRGRYSVYYCNSSKRLARVHLAGTIRQENVMNLIRSCWIYSPSFCSVAWRFSFRFCPLNRVLISPISVTLSTHCGFRIPRLALTEWNVRRRMKATLQRGLLKLSSEIFFSSQMGLGPHPQPGGEIRVQLFQQSWLKKTGQMSEKVMWTLCPQKDTRKCCFSTYSWYMLIHFLVFGQNLVTLPCKSKPASHCGNITLYMIYLSLKWRGVTSNSR